MCFAEILRLSIILCMVIVTSSTQAGTNQIVFTLQHTAVLASLKFRSNFNTWEFMENMTSNDALTDNFSYTYLSMLESVGLGLPISANSLWLQSDAFIIACTEFEMWRYDIRGVVEKMSESAVDRTEFLKIDLILWFIRIWASSWTVGLHMILNIEQSEYIPQTGDLAGIRLVLLSQGEMPFPEDDGAIIKPGFHTSIAIKQVSYATLT